MRTCGRRPRPAWLPAGVGYAAVDLAGDEPLDDLVGGVDVVFHLAGASSSRSDQEEMLRSNVGGTERVATAALEAGASRFVHMSSTSVYGEEEQLPSPVPETVEPRPSRGYGKAKWLAEQALARVADKGLATVVVRPVSVHGPGGVKLVASAMLDAALEARAGLGSFAVHRVAVEQRVLHVDDLVAACVHLASCDDAVGRVFNVGSGQYPTSHEVAAWLADAFGLQVSLDDDPDCGPGYEERRRMWDEARAAGMTDDIILTRERLRFMRKVNPNNRISLDALAATGFEVRHPDMAADIGPLLAWYRRHHWLP